MSVVQATTFYLGCLFVVTMYQISYSIKMINEPETDIVQNEKRWNKVYLTAIIVSLIFSIGVILGEFDFNNDDISS